MSDQSQGPGWWLASDGKWYPPDQAPAVPSPDTWATPPTGPPPSSRMSTGAKVVVAVVGGVVGLIILSVLAVTLLGEESDSRFESTGTAIGEGSDDDADDEDGDERGSTAVDVPEGYAVIEGDGVSIAAPDDWQEVDPEDFAMSPEEFEAAFPDASPGFLEQASNAFQQGATLVAFDLDDEFGSNVNIASFPGEAPLSMLEGQATTQLEALDGTVVSSEAVTVPEGDAVRLEYTIPVTLPDGSSVQANGVQHYVVADGRTHVVTITTIDEVAALADTMIDTFRTG